MTASVFWTLRFWTVRFCPISWYHQLFDSSGTSRLREVQSGTVGSSAGSRGGPVLSVGWAGRVGSGWSGSSRFAGSCPRGMWRLCVSLRDRVRHSSPWLEQITKKKNGPGVLVWNQFLLIWAQINPFIDRTEESTDLSGGFFRRRCGHVT